MDLNSYLLMPDAPTVPELRRRMAVLGYDIKSDAQIRQWQHKYAGRLPSPENCLAIERATDGVVTRKDLRADDYWLIWPDLSAPLRIAEVANV